MIIAVTDAHGGMDKSMLAGRLAAARALAGRKVPLLDADPRRRALECCAARPKLVARALSAKGLRPQPEHLVNCAPANPPFSQRPTQRRLGRPRAAFP
ncbi:Mrp family chromosome partitioning ATPase [Janthinobacterium sp. CG_23.3]|uniref:hypothetical protein n=1 Tax=Janthinobacterium sp. CG_23.3 TaxID=3349634 RepID=UPI0038D45EF3